MADCGDQHDPITRLVWRDGEQYSVTTCAECKEELGAVFTGRRANKPGDGPDVPKQRRGRWR